MKYGSPQPLGRVFQVDSELDPSSSNPVQNAAIAAKIYEMGFIIKETGTFSIAAKTAVATTDVNIEFAESYDAAPRVLVVGNNTSAAVYGIPCLTANSTTGATVRLRNTAAHSNAASFRWFSISSV